MEARILTIKNLINPAVMPGYSEIAGQVKNTHAATAYNFTVDNIPGRSIITVIATSQVTADGSTPVVIGHTIAAGTKAGTQKVTLLAVPALSTCSFVIKYSESEVITPKENNAALTITAALQ